MIADELDVAAVRRAYPVLEELAYFNTGTYGLMAEPVLEGYLARLSRFERRGMAGVDNLRGEIERARCRLAGHLGAGVGELALTGNATDGIALVAAGLRWEEGDEVIISDQEHPAMAVPFAHAARRFGVRVRAYPVSWEAEESLAAIRSLITPRTRMIATSHVTSPYGIRLPVREIAALAHEHGLPCLVDAAQSFAVLPVDVREIGCEFLTGNGHKWLGGPKGTGFLYARRDWMEQLQPALVGDGSMVRGTDALQPDGHRFEFGTRGFATPAGLNDALDWLERWGWDRVSHRIETLSGRLKDALQDAPGVEICTPRAWRQASGLISVAVPGQDEAALQADLVAHGLFPRTTGPKGSHRLRVSTAFFNDEDEVDRLAARIREFAART
ncbi:MAG: aminotransferase class V-fold PLP-dependent enzyme [Candidatus Dormibacteraceae bacterium]